MSGIGSVYFLSSDDFYLAGSPPTAELCTDIQGFSFLMFYSPNCPHSVRLKPIFMQLAQLVVGCQFALLNADQNRNVIYSSLNSTTPIRSVPTMLFCHNGRPRYAYNGRRDLESIKAFIVEVANSTMAELKRGGNVELSDPSRPLYHDDDCSYLPFIEAYPHTQQRR
jgi:thiol-disulfide isomerase/thioredoxin